LCLWIPLLGTHSLDPRPMDGLHDIDHRNTPPGTAAFLECALAAQNSVWVTALQEITDGAKTSHWIWWCWPAHAKVRDTSEPTYSLRHTRDAVGWLRHPTLGPRFVELTTMACSHLERDVSPTVLFGSRRDVTKFHECATLFGLAAAADKRREETALCARALSLLHVSPHPRAARIATEELAERIIRAEWDKVPPASLDEEQTLTSTMTTKRHEALHLASKATEADKAGRIDAALEDYIQAGSRLLAYLAGATDPADVTAVRARALACIERAEVLKQSTTARSRSLPAATPEPTLLSLFPLVPVSAGTHRLVRAQSEVLRDIIHAVLTAGVENYVKTGHWAWYVWPTRTPGAADHLQVSVTSVADVRHVIRGPTLATWTETLDVLAQALLARKRGRQHLGRPPPHLDVIFPSQDYERIDQFIHEWTAPEYCDATIEQPAFRAAFDRFSSAWDAVRDIREPPPHRS